MAKYLFTCKSEQIEQRFSKKIGYRPKTNKLVKISEKIVSIHAALDLAVVIL